LYKYTHLTHPYILDYTASFKDYEWIQVADNGTLESRRHQTKLWSSLFRTYNAIDGENFNKETEIQFKIERNKTCYHKIYTLFLQKTWANP